jgi:glycolate oxidase
MTIPRNAYKALESVVGPENITEDPAILLGYAYSMGVRFLPVGPEAAILPGSTEEVQGIVKVCNRYNVKYKAHSTGYGMHALPNVEGVVAVDLRRMDRIVDIDEENMYAVIEPYATAVQIQAEAMKRGLNCHVVTCGGHHSPLASATSYEGWSTMGLTTSQNARNLFGVEWVTPTGQIVRLGSPGCGAGWFSGDGPGPSLRGIIRGMFGAKGGLGIFTRIGYKLYPWPGPAEPERTGEHPQIGWEVPENFKYCFSYWKTWEDTIEAAYRITEERVAYVLNRLPPDQASWALVRSNNEYYELFEKKALHFKREHQKGFNIIIAARKESEFKYKMKVLEKIVEETKGKFLSFSPEQEAFLFGFHLHNNNVVRGARTTGTIGGSCFGHFESMGLVGKVVEEGERSLAEDYIRPHLLKGNDTEGFWGWPTEGKHWWQEGTFLVNDNSDAPKAGMQYMMKTINRIFDAKGGLGMQFNVNGALLAEMYGPKLGNVQDWMRKIKNAFDPQNSSDHVFYVSPASQEPSSGPDSPIMKFMNEMIKTKGQ